MVSQSMCKHAGGFHPIDWHDACESLDSCECCHAVMSSSNTKRMRWLGLSWNVGIISQIINEHYTPQLQNIALLLLVFHSLLLSCVCFVQCFWLMLVTIYGLLLAALACHKFVCVCFTYTHVGSRSILAETSGFYSSAFDKLLISRFDTV